jgi:large subunit ribosomal protein L21
MAESEANAAPDPAVEAPRSRETRETRDSTPAYAIIETGGKQYRVAVGERLAVEKLQAEPGAGITFDRVLMVNDGGAVRVGTPLVTGATVSAEVEEQFRGHKIVVFKYKPKKRYRRRLGHRQSLTRVAITAINV